MGELTVRAQFTCALNWIKRQPCLRVGVFGVYVMVLGLQCYALLATHQARKSTLPDNFGNFDRVREKLSHTVSDVPFTFVVVGDTRSKGTFELLAQEINAANPAFIVMLGDWVDAGCKAWHDYFRSECREYGFLAPVFFAPGNHDVDPVTYPLETFEREYGPRNFSFVYNDSLFVFISHLDGRFSNQDSLNYLRSLAGQDIGKYRKRLVFMHIPPWVSQDIKERHTEDEVELMHILEEMHIDYAIAADYHGYNRTLRGGVEYVVTGGGGASLHESVGPQFHHAIALSIGIDMVSERIIPIRARTHLGDWLELNCVVHVGPALFSHLSAFLAANTLVVAGFWLWRVRDLKRRTCKISTQRRG